MKIGIELHADIDISEHKIGDNLLINGKSYRVVGFKHGIPHYLRGESGLIYRIVTTI